jgi:hypothetical protein
MAPAAALIEVPRASFRPGSEEQAASHNTAVMAAKNLSAGIRLYPGNKAALMSATSAR